jgi:hypothetical protein
MISFQTKKSNLGKYWGSLDGKMLIYFMAFGIFCAYLVHFCNFGIMLCTKKNLATLPITLVPTLTTPRPKTL